MQITGQPAELTIAVHHRPFVGGDGVHPALQSGPKVVQRRLAGLVVDRSGFHQGLRAGGLQELRNLHRRGGAGQIGERAAPFNDRERGP